MSSFVGVLVSDQDLQSQFTQVELRTLKSKVCIFLPSSIVFRRDRNLGLKRAFCLLRSFSMCRKGLNQAVLLSEICLLFLRN